MFNENWLTDNVINFHFSEPCASFEDVCFDTFLTFRLPTFGLEFVSNSLIRNGVNLFTYRLILVPVIVNNSHWILFSIDIHRRSITCLDSWHHNCEIDRSDFDFDKLYSLERF